MNKQVFETRLFKTGEVEPKEIVQYMLKYYYLKGKTIEDFKQDIINKLGSKYTIYAEALEKDFTKAMKQFTNEKL